MISIEGATDCCNIYIFFSCLNLDLLNLSFDTPATFLYQTLALYVYMYAGLTRKIPFLKENLCYKSSLVLATKDTSLQF